MNKLPALLNELEAKIPHHEKLNATVSASSVGWHIDHSILVCNQIIAAVEKSNPKDYTWKFDFKRTIVFALGKIPRGKGKAPTSVIPAAKASPEKMKVDCALLKETIKKLSVLPPNHYFKHPLFGLLNVKATIKMLKIHTRHHLSIINDICKTA
jgi:hypothetical protein